MPFIAKTIRKGTVPNRTVLLILGTLLLLTDCAPTQYIPLPEHHTRDSTHLSVYTRVDSIREYVSDSISIRFAKGVVPASQRYTVPSGRYTSDVSSAGGDGIPDTVYIDRWHTAYRDRWHTLNHTDTIRITRRDSIPYPVEVTKYIRQRNLYDRATSCGFWLLLSAILLFLLARFLSYRLSSWCC